ncbi:MAG: biotin transporter BioY, partial [Pseudomonadota bacterium]|nr:biotin transporter BioY [Pseudomonadota bacterium]
PMAAVASVLGGIVVLYACGILGMSLVLKKSLVESTLLMAAFIPGDLLKAAIAAMLTASLARARPGSLMSRRVATGQ